MLPSDINQQTTHILSACRRFMKWLAHYLFIYLFIYLFMLSLLRVIILQCQCTDFQAGPHLDVLQYLQ